MGMHPIDLQTLYTHLDHVGKLQSAQQQASAAQQSAAAATAAKEQQKTDTVVKNLDMVQDESEKVSDERESSQQQQSAQDNREKQNTETSDTLEQGLPRLKAPSTGVYIDIEG